LITRRKDLGDCINCQLCVQVCPTGIDIRDGLQYECISCSACIDACDSVMDTMGYPRGLIRYTTQNAIDGKSTRILRPRVFIYGTILLILLGSIIVGVAMRTPFNYDILRDRQSLYRELGGGMIENTYTVRILNKDRVSHTYQFSADGLPGLEVVLDHENVTVDAGAVSEVPVRLRANEEVLSQRSQRVDFYLRTEEHPDVNIRREARFLGPTR
jgi:cytochrome c oxidase accessory protein FixG